MAYNEFRPEVIDRFWGWVDRSGGPDACWPWTGYCDSRSGYGRFRVDTIGYLPHRWLLGMQRGRPLVWSLEVREVACHKCDNPPCCNPAHLYVGDPSQNMRDSVLRGRHFEASQTNCKQGHPLFGDNLYLTARQRCCRICRTEWQRKADRKRRAKT